LHHNGQNNTYSHAETSGARWGSFFGFSCPTLHQFSQILCSDRFWRTAGALSKTVIFFKLQAGVSLVSSAPPPIPCHARTTPKTDRLKSLYYWQQTRQFTAKPLNKNIYPYPSARARQPCTVLSIVVFTKTGVKLHSDESFFGATAYHPKWSWTAITTAPLSPKIAC
jgi:hypothetical protein